MSTIGPYTDVELIGRGGFGSVYRADDPDHGRQVAIKVLDLTLDAEASRRFDRERQLLGRLGSHPNIISIFDSGVTPEGQAYIVMELAPLGSLRDQLDRQGGYPWKEATALVAAIARAVAVAHERGILHRDIKPENILVDEYGNPRLTDFGVAALTTGATSTQAASATLAHTAPEVLDGAPSTEATDVYALGSTLHTLIIGTPPFVRGTDEGLGAMMRRTLAEPPPDLRRWGVPDELAVVVDRSLAKAPADRQASADELAAMLEQFADRTAGGVLTSPPRAAASPAPSPAGALRAAERGLRRRGLLVGALLAVLVASAVGAVAAFGGDDEDAEPIVTSTTADSSPVPTSTSTTVPVPTTPVVSVAVDCPAEVAFGQRLTCSITSSGVVSGTWALPGFLEAALPLATVNGPNEVFIEPNDPSAVGRTFTITATVTAVDGSQSAADHSFTIVGPSVTIVCPPSIAAGTSIVCEIVSERALRGRWSIPGFAEADLETVPGSNPIFINPNESAVGQTFVATAVVEDDFGLTATASASFTVSAG